MPTRIAEAEWNGSLREGNGKMKFGGGAFEGAYSYGSRFENAKGTNPEELIGAAHAGCFSMAFSANLGKAGFTPQHIHTTAQVTIESVEGKTRITGIRLETEARVPGIDAAQFQQIAEDAKQTCPVSMALSSVPITLVVKLLP